MAQKHNNKKTEQSSSQMSVDTAYAQALNHFNAGQFQDVDKLCTAIIQAVPNHIDAINLIGVVAQRLGMHEQAVEQFSRAIAIDNSRAMLQFNLGISLNQLGKNKEAIKVLETALTIEPDNSQVLELLKTLNNGSTDNITDIRAQDELVQGIDFHNAGLLEKAIACYQRVLELQADNPQALGNLATVLQSQGELKKAVVYYLKALEVQPNNADVLSNLGIAYTELTQLDDAVEVLNRAISINPNNAVPHYNLGNALQEQNKLPEAIESYNKAILINPGIAQAYCNLGNALKEQGKFKEAIAIFNKAITIKPDYIEALTNLGVVLKDSGNLLDAIASNEKAITINPDYAPAYNNLGLAMQAQQKIPEAITYYQKAIAIKGDYVETLSNLGDAYCVQGNFNEAIVTLQKAISFNPSFATAYYNLGNAQVYMGKLDDSIASFKKAISIQSDYAQAHSNLGKAYSDQCKLDEAIACFKQAILLQPDMVQTYSNLLLCSQYIYSQNLDNLLALHKECANIPALSIAQQCFVHKNNKNPNRKLRIGFVSADFGHHPIGYFLSGFFERHNNKEIEIICYSDRIADDITDLMRGYADEWFETKQLLDDELAKKIYSDEIDILVDLAGHTAHNRLKIFAKKPAPIQVSWAGYVGTTGLPAMDWLIADKYYVTHEEDKFYTESIIRLADSWASYTPPQYAPLVYKNSYRETNSGFVLANFGNPSKINETMLGVWSQILNSCPEASLLLIYKGMDDPANVKRITGYFANSGIDINRVKIEGYIPHSELLDRYKSVDLALDSIPYSGGLTTMEALWMGVPVVTTVGSTFAGRHAQSILMCVGLAELVTKSLPEYADLVVDLIKTPKRLNRIRSGLSNKVANSPLCDHKRFTIDLTAQFRKIWQNWCSTK
ncbi:MAG: tetratricopeptide repeat protein [Magnetococcales bacterium]|nr:tetratricopeptide repeat protein [Magnetococcales bacterium]